MKSRLHRQEEDRVGCPGGEHPDRHNFVANVLLVYLLGTFWADVAPVRFDPCRHRPLRQLDATLVTAAISSAALLAIYWSRGSKELWAGAGSASRHLIVFISLFVNSVARLVMQMKGTAASRSTVDSKQRQRSQFPVPRPRFHSTRTKTRRLTFATIPPVTTREKGTCPLPFTLIPKEEKFFDILEEAAENVHKATLTFKDSWPTGRLRATKSNISATWSTKATG